MNVKIVFGAGIAIAIALIVIILYGGINISDIVEDDFEYVPPSTTDCSYDTTDIYFALQALSGKSLDWQTSVDFIQALEMTMCGADDTNRFEIVDEFNNAYVADNWTLTFQTIFVQPGWTADYLVYQKVDLYDTLLIGDGATISDVYHHDVMYLTGRGSAATYVAFHTFLTT